MVAVAISGLHGAGKSTTAKALAKRFRSLRYLCAGDIFRELIKEKGMTLKEGQRYAERHPSIDQMIDRKIADAARGGKVLIDARLAGWMAKKADLKIFLTAPIKVRVKRIAQREGRRYRDVYDETVKREKSEAKRFKKLYNIDINDYSIFDIVVNTERLSIAETTKILAAAIEAVMKRRR
ncbi:MAG: AAA family ATPase [Candidatus Hadarchaeum sp.]|uniref:(d)CMP kinase n=1 Tax=Candidatus Hadarchaeum sp. TaxID=2883567 RepID=UPI00317D9FB4